MVLIQNVDYNFLVVFTGAREKKRDKEREEEAGERERQHSTQS